MPVQLPRSAFTRNHARAGDAPLRVTETYLTAARARPLGDGFEVGHYRIHRARHAGNPGTALLLSMEHGEHLIVAVHPSDGKVGFVRRDFLWVHPDHRGNNLGPEMAAELIVAMGCETWTIEQWHGWLDTPRFTSDGARNRTKVYDVLVRRGIVEPPDNT